MELWIKICGVRTIEGAEAVRDAGGDFAGLNFVKASRRSIDPSAAREIRARLGAVVPVGVFKDQDQRTIESIADEVGLEWVQLHGAEPPEQCRALAVRFRVLKAFNLDRAFDPTVLDAYRDHVAAFVFDGPHPGSGEPFDGALVRSTPVDRPYFIAGGLTPENVAEAVKAYAPRGVDTASGIEDAAGDQDQARIAAFVHRARIGA